jgi:hypothetical protein
MFSDEKHYHNNNNQDESPIDFKKLFNHNESGAYNGNLAVVHTFYLNEMF